jgi:small ligand-binding sensory domain FIST
MSQHPLATHAVGEVVGEVLDRLGGRPDAAVVFVTGPFAGAMEDIAAAIRTILEPTSLIGATAASVLGADREVEGLAAISLLAMRFGPVLRYADAPVTEVVRLERATPVAAPPGATLVLLADPFSFPLDDFARTLPPRSPGLTVVGGLASAASGPGGNRLVADGAVHADGAVGLLLPPGVGVTPVVSQGCRPVGDPLVVTRASGTLIEEIAGQPALDRLLAQADEATPQDRGRMAKGLHVGIAVDERKVDLEPGDFLVRSVLGADKARRAVAVEDEVEVGSIVQFQVRDATSADADLRDLLADASGDAALVFAGTGRGTALFEQPHHDAAVIHQHLDGGAVAGMFSAGEIGPIGDRHFVHRTSTCVLLFDDPF